MAMLPWMVTYITVLIAATVLSSSPSTAAYTNHTVGGPAGWFFNGTTNTSLANYSSWAAPITFNLGDFLIFNTNTNQTVVQTNNATTYDSCTADDSSDSDTLIFDSGAATFGQPTTIDVPLTKLGPNYFFSDANDGAQCLHGMRFEIDVKEGSGLPPSLNQPPPPPYTPPPVAEPPPVFQGSGGGQGERIHNGVGRIVVGGLTGAAAALMHLGLCL